MSKETIIIQIDLLINICKDRSHIIRCIPISNEVEEYRTTFQYLYLAENSPRVSCCEPRKGLCFLGASCNE